MKAKDEIDEILRRYGSKKEVDAIALSSKNGVPIASHLKKEEENESFSTLSATMLGASEVIFSGFEREDPDFIVGYSDDSVLLIKEVGSNTVLSILGDSDKEKEMMEEMEEMASKLSELEETFKTMEVLKK
ncbi:MAG: roadblock/LC7 domain-containing protein [Candidatus Thermoplasmatota archaeon]|nr:roadblock/LC7 domain-containing protein [Candidatus Thermoplasmatota archaeon]MBS3789351.1 roadblock/LC7 domain-containing protein [Candidatus Thermoplasmatota archaeon]